jgi:hypothetical protein
MTNTATKSAPVAAASAKATTAVKVETPAIAPQPVDKKYTFRGREFVDLRGASGTMAAKKAGAEAEHKYVKIHAAAEAAGSPCKLGWRYATKIFVAGSSKVEKKEGTAHGIIQSLVKQAGTAGISGMELVPLVRAAAKKNTRTNFGAGQVPPIGWAEGWIDSAITGNLIKSTTGELKLEDVAPVAEPVATAKAA